MSEELQDEVTSINSIYGPSTLTTIETDPEIYALTLPSQPSISLRIDFPPNYPDAPPSILGTQTVGDHLAKGDGAHLVDLARAVLGQLFTPGVPCIFDLIEEAAQQLDRDFPRAGDTEPQAPTQAHSQTAGADPDFPHPSSDGPQALTDQLGDAPPWTLSDVMVEKKSVFVARSAPVTSIDQAKQYLVHLLATDKKVAKATHNITAWRIRGEGGVQYQDCDDDGETAAGGRLLHLLELMGVWDAMVVVTRWYGGVQLGPDRFRIINQTAREALVKGELAPEAGRDGGKKKGRK